MHICMHLSMLCWVRIFKSFSVTCSSNLAYLLINALLHSYTLCSSNTRLWLYHYDLLKNTELVPYTTISCSVVLSDPRSCSEIQHMAQFYKSVLLLYLRGSYCYSSIASLVWFLILSFASVLVVVVYLFKVILKNVVAVVF